MSTRPQFRHDQGARLGSMLFALAPLALVVVLATVGCGGGGGIDLGDLGGDDASSAVDSSNPGFGIDGSIDTSGSGCKKQTCAAAHANCGPVADGCGGLLASCGSCKSPEVCGGGGKPSLCGNSLAADGGVACPARTCASVGASCGPVGDGCGGLLDCGSCAAPATCGGGGTPSVCGSSSATSDGGTIVCKPRTCADLGASCGPEGDGCGGALDCGTCAAPASCGGAGTPSVCGVASGDAGVVCTPTTCAAAGATCGPIGDGCGGLIPTCGTCTAPDICGGGGTPSVCGGGVATGDAGPSCTGLCSKRVKCPTAGVTTTISGTIVAPTPAKFLAPGASPDPIYGAYVYVPNAPVAAFTPGVSCDKCGAAVSGSPIVSAVTGPDGKFTLKDVPVGTGIPLVIQLGRWRRQITIPVVAACVDTPLSLDQTRLPRNKAEGDIPLMAMATGNVDTLECVLRKIGLDEAEFTQPGGGGRIELYVANGANAGAGTPNENALWGSATTLARYDAVLFPCEGRQRNEAPISQKNVIDYSNLGGRVFATHYSYVWLYDDAPFSSTATWNVDQPHPTSGDLVPLTGIVDTSFPKGVAFSTWLDIVGASKSPGSSQIDILYSRHDLDGVVPPSQRWIYSDTPDVPTVQHYTFNTPIGTAPADQCGRTVFSDFHVNNAAASGGTTFPAECDDVPMSAQEKVLEFMLFDLSSCVTPDTTPPPPPPTCTKTTCAALGVSCGPAGDGCGGAIDCGTCTAPATCGGGGVPGACGTPPSCKPRTCADQGISCGPAGDGCGGGLDCGPCVAPDSCGGGGVPGVCGHGDGATCAPITCAAQGLSCGPAGDGCGGKLDCGPCPPGEACGGGGTPGKCGGPGCTKTTCAAAGANCGPIGDGCGGTLDCGVCTPPQSCGGGGVASVCGGGTR